MQEPNRWRMVKKILSEAMDLPREDRKAHVAQACRHEPHLLQEALAILDDTEQGDSESIPFISQPLAMSVSQLGGGLPETIGPYKVKRELGRGHAGAVYLAEDRPGQCFAVKLCPEACAPASSFQKETLPSAPCLGPIRQVKDLENGGLYVVMEYITGLPLDCWLKQHEWDLNGRLELFSRLCNAVGLLHQAGVVHGNLKPGNILVDQEGEPIILESGLTPVIQPPPAVGAGGGLDLSNYLSPEQVRDGRVHKTSDVYALGVLLYELMTGQPPYQLHQCRAREVRKRLFEEAPPRPSTICRHPVHSHLDQLVMKALRKNPEARYPSASQFAEAVADLIRESPVSQG